MNLLAFGLAVVGLYILLNAWFAVALAGVVFVIGKYAITWFMLAMLLGVYALYKAILA